MTLPAVRAKARSRVGRPVKGVARLAASQAGTLSNWFPTRLTDWTAPRERAAIQDRAEDLAHNDPHAAGLVGGMAVNIVGPGLRPQSRLDHRRLGIAEEQAEVLQDQLEAAFAEWIFEADAAERMNFFDFQFLNVMSLLIKGEFFNLCVDKNLEAHPERKFAFALQALSPARVFTPAELVGDPSVDDGIELGPYREAAAYFVAEPDPFTGRIDRFSGFFTRHPAKIGHLRPVLHGFFQREEEQTRGVSILAPAMKFFRDLSDYLDYELAAQIISAAFPVAIETHDAAAAAGISFDNIASRGEPNWHREVRPGNVMYLNPGENIRTLDSKRPGSSFAPFVERILRAAGAAAGMPYEVVARDFSKTNYSSARAALLEAWKAFRVYQRWLEHRFCRPVWARVIEEAFLRGRIVLPAGAPGFYSAMGDYLAADWIPPRRGHVDPVKEAQGDLLRLSACTASYADVTDGEDPEAVFSRLARERRLIEKYGLEPNLSASKTKTAGGNQAEADPAEADPAADDAAVGEQPEEAGDAPAEEAA